MAILGTSYQIGRSALAAYQAAISVTGQNIANVGNADYTRQSAHLSAITGSTAGMGVTMSALQRHADEALEARLRDSYSTLSASQLRYQYLSQVESLYNELTDNDLSTQLSELFGSFGQLETDPEDTGLRNILLASADTVVKTLNSLRSGLQRQIVEMNDAADAGVRTINELSAEVARLNETIAVQESDGMSVASALRDQRDALLRQMSEMANIRVNYLDNGTANVYIDSQPLVEFNRAREMEISREFENGIEVSVVRWSDNNGRVTVADGQLAGIANTRDDYIMSQIEQLDELANGLIYEVNRVHASGVGLIGRESALSGNAVTDATAALNNAGLAFPVENGTFIVNVRDTVTGQITTRQIEVDLDGIGGDTSLTSLAAALNDVPNLTASVTSDNRLKIESDTDTEFWFSEDSSGAMAALGVGTFFEGTNAGDIAIRQDIQNNPKLIAASADGGLADGDIAGRLSMLADESSSLLNSQSIIEYQTRMVNSLAVAAAGALTSYEASDTVYASLTAQRESISGVSLDEEALNLTVYERAYQGASRYLSVVESLSDELLSLLA